MIVSFHPCFDTDVHIVLGSRKLAAPDLEIIRQAEAVILPQGRVEDFREVCSRPDPRLFPNYFMRVQYPGKIGQSRLFSDLGLSQPGTLSWPSAAEFKKACPKPEDIPHEFPFLIKEDKSHEAEGVFLVEDPKALDPALDFLIRRETSGYFGFVTQDFVPSGGNVLRAVIMGTRIITYWKRPQAPDQMITTISKGALVDHDWRPDLQDKAKKASQQLVEKTGINLAAVDLLFNMMQKDPEPLFLEINYYFGRKGLGGSERYYGLLYQAVREWLEIRGVHPDRVRLI
jgi:ribosomal protein S6--L-glutamate ligase